MQENSHGYQMSFAFAEKQNKWAATSDFQQSGLCDQQKLRSAFASRLKIPWILG